MASEDEPIQSTFSCIESNLDVALRMGMQTAQPFLEKEVTATRTIVVLYPALENGNQSMISATDQHHKLMVEIV